MNDDRSRPERMPGRAPEAEGPREGWFDRLLDLLHFGQRDSAREELEDALAGTDEAGFSVRERTMLRNVLAFHKVRVGDVMVPRADIAAVSDAASLGALLTLLQQAGHSRLPVYGESLDDPKGMVHIRDVLGHLALSAEAAPGQPSLAGVDLGVTLEQAGLIRPVLYVPGSMPAIDLLVRMQTTRTHIALVIDEHGGTDGLVSIEDLIEMVVGDIEDEHDTASGQPVAAAEDGSWLADARAGLDEVSAALGLDLTRLPDAEGIDTLAGLVVGLAGRVPSPGEMIHGPEGLAFEVLEADPRRLKRLRVRRGGEAEAAPQLGAQGRTTLVTGSPAKPDASAA